MKDSLNNYFFNFSNNLLKKILILFFAMVVIIGILIFFIKMDVSIDATGVIIPTDYVTISSSTNGKVVKCYAVDNKYFHKGELLILLDTVEICNEISILRNDIQKSTIEMEQKYSELHYNEISVMSDIEQKENEIKNAEYDYKLLLSEYASNKIISQIYDMDSTQNRIMGTEKNLKLKIKENQIDMLKIKSNQLGLQRAKLFEDRKYIKSYEMDIEIKKIKLNQLFIELSKKHISAPIDGYVKSSLLENLDNQFIQTGEKLFTISAKRWVLLAYIQEEDLSKVKVGQKAIIKLISHPYIEYRSFNGTIKKISNNYEKSSNGIMMYEAIISFNDNSIYDYGIIEGFNAQINIVTYSDRIVDVIKRELFEKVSASY